MIAIVEAIQDIGGTLAKVFEVKEVGGEKEFGGLLGGVLDLFTEAGGKMIGEWVASVAGEFVPALVEGIVPFIEGLVSSLPEIIRSVLLGLPGLIVSGIKLAIMLIPELVIALVEVFADPATWVGLGAALLDALTTSLENLWQSLEALFEGLFGETDEPGLLEKGGWFDTAGQDIGGLFGDGHASGITYADKTGLRLVHAGETVRRASEGIAATGAGLATGRGRMYGSGGRAVVEIDLDSLYDTLQGASRRGYSVEG